MTVLTIADLSVEERLALLYLDTAPVFSDLPVELRDRLLRRGLAQRTSDSLIYTPIGRQIAREITQMARKAA